MPSVIALDAMGSDKSPRPEVDGALQAVRQYGVRVMLVGREPQIRAELERHSGVEALPIEIIHASEVKGGLRKEDVLSLFASAPSLRYLAEMSDSIPGVEGQWHRIYLHLQSLLGQLKVQQNKQAEKATGGWSLFGKK